MSPRPTRTVIVGFVLALGAMILMPTPAFAGTPAQVVVVSPATTLGVPSCAEAGGQAPAVGGVVSGAVPVCVDVAGTGGPAPSPSSSASAPAEEGGGAEDDGSARDALAATGSSPWLVLAAVGATVVAVAAALLRRTRGSA